MSEINYRDLEKLLIAQPDKRGEYETKKYKAVIWYYDELFHASITRQGVFFALRQEPTLEQLIQTIQYEITEEQV